MSNRRVWRVDVPSLAELLPWLQEAETAPETEHGEQATPPLEASSLRSPEDIFTHLLKLRLGLVELYDDYRMWGGERKRLTLQGQRGTLKTQADTTAQAKPTKRKIPWLQARFADLKKQLDNSGELKEAAIKVRRAWSALPNKETRQQVLDLLHSAYTEACWMILTADLNAKWRKKQNQAQERSAEKRRQKAQTAARKFCEAVETSGETFLEALVAFLPNTPPASLFILRVRKYLDGVRDIVQSFQQIEQKLPNEATTQEVELAEEATSPERGPNFQQIEQKLPNEATTQEVELAEEATSPERGPKGLEERNTAILEIEKIFRRVCSSNRQALIHTHTLLYVAGLWTDPKPDSLGLKAANLRLKAANLRTSPCTNSSPASPNQ